MVSEVGHKSHRSHKSHAAGKVLAEVMKSEGRVASDGPQVN